MVILLLLPPGTRINQTRSGNFAGHWPWTALSHQGSSLPITVQVSTPQTENMSMSLLNHSWMLLQPAPKFQNRTNTSCRKESGAQGQGMATDIPPMLSERVGVTHVQQTRPDMPQHISASFRSKTLPLETQNSAICSISLWHSTHTLYIPPECTTVNVPEPSSAWGSPIRVSPEGQGFYQAVQV